MTREEASRIIREIQFPVNGDNKAERDSAIEMAIKALEQEPKTGHWIIDGHHRKCSECEEYFCNEDKENNTIPNRFCPNCGARMVEQKESEG